MVQPLPAVLVTGGARRIGRAIVEDLARNGWAVAIHYRASHDAAAALAAGIAKVGGRATIVGGDLADLAGLGGIVEDASRALGPLTLLVNNASVFEKDTVGELDRDLWQRQMTVNLTAPVFLAEAFARQVPAEAEGNVVNLLDQRIWRPTPRYFSYQISKSALYAATETLAQALAPRIRVNGIAPGPVLPSAHQTVERFEKQTAAIPLQRAPELADFGRTVRYLVENRSITGQIIALDGGQHLGWRTPDVAATDTSQ
ncbi:MAG: SDR family oxidoreductase [Bauldia sp.]|nr:SDR family oxidoreductase [Bauldia sp.]